MTIPRVPSEEEREEFLAEIRRDEELEIIAEIEAEEELWDKGEEE